MNYWSKFLSATTPQIGFLQSVLPWQILPGTSSYTRADSNLCTCSARGKRMVLYQAITKQTRLSTGFLFMVFTAKFPAALSSSHEQPLPWCGQGCAGCAPSVCVRSREAPPGDTELGALWHTRDTWSSEPRPMTADSTHAHKFFFSE